MENPNFAVAYSEKLPSEAIKEISLKIKLVFPKQINHLLVFFTPHYAPAQILKTINLALNPLTIVGIQAPLLICEDRVLQKGVVACCINKEQVKFKPAFLKSGEPQTMESFFRLSFKKLRKENFCLLSFLTPSINPSAFASSIHLSLGQIFNFVGSGFITRYGPTSYQIVNDTVNEGLVVAALEGLQTKTLRLGGYVPLGKPFTVTKAAAARGIINEINGQPAINVYKQYLEEKFPSFITNRLFSLYPLGIRRQGYFRLINVIDVLDDGSLLYLGRVSEHEQGHIMFLDAAFLLEEVHKKLADLKQRGSVVFIVNSITRKKIFGETFGEEIKLIKQFLGPHVKVFGIYADYSVVSEYERGNVDVETNNLLLTMWQ